MLNLPTAIAETIAIYATGTVFKCQDSQCNKESNEMLVLSENKPDLYRDYKHCGGRCNELLICCMKNCKVCTRAYCVNFDGLKHEMCQECWDWTHTSQEKFSQCVTCNRRSNL